MNRWWQVLREAGRVSQRAGIAWLLRPSFAVQVLLTWLRNGHNLEEAINRHHSRYVWRKIRW